MKEFASAQLELFEKGFVKTAIAIVIAFFVKSVEQSDGAQSRDRGIKIEEVASLILADAHHPLRFVKIGSLDVFHRQNILRCPRIISTKVSMVTGFSTSFPQ
jgi:hypothetical protein